MTASAPGPIMSPHDALNQIAASPVESRKRSSWSSYVTSLLLTAVGLGLVFWSAGQGVLMALDAHDRATEISVATLVFEGVAGAVTTVFGFAMLVQVTPSADTEIASVWALPEQRTFEDEPPATSTS